METGDQVPTELVSGKNFPFELQTAAFLLCAHTNSSCARGERERETDRQTDRGRQSSLMSLLIRTLILLDQDPTFLTSFNLSCFLRGPISKYSHTGIGISTHEFWGNTNIQSITLAYTWSSFKTQTECNLPFRTFPDPLHLSYAPIALPLAFHWTSLSTPPTWSLLSNIWYLSLRFHYSIPARPD